MTEPENSSVCTAAIEGPHVPSDEPVECTLEAGHPGHHTGPKVESWGRTPMWTDHHAGATPHREEEAP